MTKTIKRSLLGAYNYRGWVHDHRGGSLATGRQSGSHGTGIVAESSHLDNHEAERSYLGKLWAFEISKPPPSDIPSPGQCSYSFSSSSTNCGPNSHIYEPRGLFSFKPSQGHKQVISKCKPTTTEEEKDFNFIFKILYCEPFEISQEEYCILV